METYLERIRIMNSQKETQAEIEKQKRDYAEAMECTHHPRIKEMPYYVKIRLESEKDSSIRGARKEAYYSTIHTKSKTVT